MPNASGGTIAQAYVQILPSTEGIKGQLTEVLGGEAQNAGASAGGKWGGAFKKGLAVAGKAALAATAAAGAGIVALGKQALESYADYEQLTGGVETLFKDSADTVMGYAANAYKTAGLSANAYMETVTGFSASLLQSLDGDTEAAARAADMAITDMADNANKMGSSMESIQNAYQGFAKQNYTMLDNLKLGYGGTKQEMERLLKDAAALSGVEYDIGNLSDVYEAIHVVQTEMGITGTTAKEAAETISGSVAAAKSAWANLVTGIADENADLDGLIDNFVDSVLIAGENLLPRVEQILKGMGSLVTKGAERLIPILVDGLIDNAPMLVEGAVKLAAALGIGLIKGIPKLVAAIPQLLQAIVNGLGIGHGELDAASAELCARIEAAFWEKVEQAKQWGRDLVTNFTQNIQTRVSNAKAAAAQLAEQVKGSIREKVNQAKQWGSDLVTNFAQNIRNRVSSARTAASQLVETVRTAIREKINQAKQWGRDLIQNFINGIKEKWEALKRTVKDTAQTVRDFLGFSEPKEGPLSDFHTYAPDMVELWNEGLRENEGKLRQQLGLSFDLGSAIRSAAVLPEPERAPAEQRTEAFGGVQTGHRDITVILQLDRQELGRAVYRLNNEETQRVGVKLAGGVA